MSPACSARTVPGNQQLPQRQARQPSCRDSKGSLVQGGVGSEPAGGCKGLPSCRAPLRHSNHRLDLPDTHHGPGGAPPASHLQEEVGAPPTPASPQPQPRHHRSPQPQSSQAQPHTTVPSHSPAPRSHNPASPSPSHPNHTSHTEARNRKGPARVAQTPGSHASANVACVTVSCRLYV